MTTDREIDQINRNDLFGENEPKSEQVAGFSRECARQRGGARAGWAGWHRRAWYQRGARDERADSAQKRRRPPRAAVATATHTRAKPIDKRFGKADAKA